ncbi:MAG TPA: hypothetical protein VFJ58_15985 [Armatimonadota bacterium]|nr:hypothetical protein [Armatimonadota bacterium]
MSAEPVTAPDAEPEFVDKELAEEWARFRDVLWHGSMKDARAMIAEMALRWPDSERVQYYARVLVPPVARSVPGSGLSFDRERDWLRAHAREYPGCWLAVKGNELIAAEPDFQVIDRIVRQDPTPEQIVLYFSAAREMPLDGQDGHAA